MPNYYGMAMRFKHEFTPNDLSHYLTGEVYYYSAVGIVMPTTLLGLLTGPLDAYSELIRTVKSSPFWMNADNVDVSGVQTLGSYQQLMDFIHAGTHSDLLLWSRLNN